MSIDDFNPRAKLYTPHFFIRVIRYCSAQGLSESQLLQGTGVEASTLFDAATRVSLKQTLKLAENALGLTGDPALGLRIGCATNDEDGGITTKTASAGANFWQKARTVERYHRLSGQIMLPQWSTEDDLPLFRLTAPSPLGALQPLFVEECFSSLREALNRYYDTTTIPTVVRLSYAEPAHAAAYEAYFQCPLEFNAPRNEFVCNFFALKDVRHEEHPLNFTLLEQMCQSMDTRAGVVDEARSILMQHSDSITMTEVAQRLGMTSRTLGRHLHEHDTSYRALKDEVRLIQARQLLSSTHMTVEQIADAIGFRSTRRFRDFFSRHMGQSPSAFRR